MKAYGVTRKDHGCCPGHDKYPKDRYANRRSLKARAVCRALAHSTARARERAELHNTLNDPGV